MTYDTYRLTYGVTFNYAEGEGRTILYPAAYAKAYDVGLYGEKWDGVEFETLDEAEAALFDTRWYWLNHDYSHGKQHRPIGNREDGSYAIWDHFSPATRQQVADTIFTWSMIKPYMPMPRNRTDRIYEECPLGVGLRIELPHLYELSEYACPQSKEVVSLLLTSHRITYYDRDNVEADAAQFIRDWDHGAIADLHKALRVT